MQTRSVFLRSMVSLSEQRYTDRQMLDMMDALERAIEHSPDSASRSVLSHVIFKSLGCTWHDAARMFDSLVRKKALKRVPGNGPFFATVTIAGENWNSLYVAYLESLGCEWIGKRSGPSDSDHPQRPLPLVDGKGTGCYDGRYREACAEGPSQHAEVEGARAVIRRQRQIGGAHAASSCHPTNLLISLYFIIIGIRNRTAKGNPLGSDKPYHVPLRHGRTHRPSMMRMDPCRLYNGRTTI